MKELTIKEKAKRYDEAKFIMEKYLKSGNAGVIAENTIKKAFPELAESEDEKIRKWLIHYFKEVCDNVSEKEKKGILAWLEKQVSVDEEKVLIGARKDVALSIMNFLDRNTLGMCLSNMECADLESAVVDSDWSKVYNYMKKKLEKQSEQKSIKTCAEYYNKDRELKMPVLSEFQDKLADIELGLKAQKGE